MARFNDDRPAVVTALAPLGGIGHHQPRTKDTAHAPT